MKNIISSEMAASMETSTAGGLTPPSTQNPQGQINSDPWVTKKFVAEHYGVCARTIERAMEHFNLPHQHFLNRVMFQISAIDAWLSTNQKFRFARARHTPVPEPVPNSVPRKLTRSHRANDPKPETRRANDKHSFGPGLHTRTCAKCGFTQSKDPSGVWVAWT